MRITASLSGLAVLVGISGAGTDAVQAQNSRPVTMLVLKDPTPRPPDLDKMYGTASTPAVNASPALQTSYFQQRQSLVTRASHQLTALAITLDRAVGGQVTEAARAQEIQVAGLIEQLAGNVRTAMAPSPAGGGKDAARTVPGGGRAAGAPDASVPLSTETAELVTVAKELEEDVDKTTPDTLPVGVLLKSSRAMALAHAVKQRIGGR